MLLQLATYAVIGSVFSLLATHPDGTAAAWVAAFAIGVGGFGVALYRHNSIRHKSMTTWATWACVGFSIIAWVMVAAGVCLFGLYVKDNRSSNKRWDAARALLYVGLALAFVADVLYVYIVSIATTGNDEIAAQDSKNEQAAIARVCTTALCLVVYGCIAASVYYMDIIFAYGQPLALTIKYPGAAFAAANCTGRSTSDDGTTLIWAKSGLDSYKCGWKVWGHLRGNLLFLLVFIIACSLSFDMIRSLTRHKDNTQPQPLPRVLALIAYAFMFASFSSIIDDLDQLWNVPYGTLALLWTYCVLAMIVAYLRNRPADAPSSSEVEPPVPQQPSQDLTPLLPTTTRASLNLDLTRRHATQRTWANDAVR
jgi:hypothetical protein